MSLEDDLQQFIGTDNWYKHWTGVLLYTDGVKYLADQAGAYWLIDAIASYQTQIMRGRDGNQRLREFQLWELTVTNSVGLLTVREDDGFEPSISQKIPYTDFPLSYIKLYVENETLCLPSER